MDWLYAWHQPFKLNYFYNLPDYSCNKTFKIKLGWLIFAFTADQEIS
jgi:hypothetical protein